MKRRLAGLVLLCTLAPAGPALASASKADGSDRVVVSGPVLVDRDETAGDVLVLDGDVVIRGKVDGDVLVADGDATIRGEVEGDVATLAGTATLGRRAVVGGDLIYANKKPVVTRGARVAGETKRFNGANIGAGAGAGIAIGFWLAVTLSLLVLGLLLLLLAPRAGDAVAATGREKPGASVGVGLLAFIVLPVLGVVACITILGLPFGIGLLMALFPLYAIAYVTTAAVLGCRIIKGSAIPAFVVGLVILRLLALIPIAGGLIGLLVMIFGLGVLFVTLFRARSGPAAHSGAAGPGRPAAPGRPVAPAAAPAPAAPARQPTPGGARPKFRS